MRPTITTVIAAMLLATLTSCSSTAITSQGHVHIGNVAGELSIAKITLPNGTTVEGYVSKNENGAKNAGSVYFWTKLWNSSAVNDLTSSAGDAIKTAVE